MPSAAHASPVNSVSIPAMTFISVDLPLPLTPMMAILASGRNCRLMLLSTGLGAPWKVFVRFFMT